VSVAAVLRGRDFIRLPPAVARRRAIQWASGLTYLSADLIAPVALWEVPTSYIGWAGHVETAGEVSGVNFFITYKGW
jgi:hypothetical protein